VHDAADSGVERGLQDGERAVRVDGVGDQRTLHRPQHRLVRSLVEHQIAALHRVPHEVFVGDGPDHQAGARIDVLAKAGIEVVEHGDVVIFGDERIDDV
jgi:hypothetical protein